MGSGGFSSAASPFGPGGMRRGPMYSGGEDLTPEDLFNVRPADFIG